VNGASTTGGPSHGLEELRASVAAGNPDLYRHVALYLQVLRSVLPERVEQACFHLATQVHFRSYLGLPANRRRGLHRQLRQRISHCSSLLTVEQLVALARRPEQALHELLASLALLLALVLIEPSGQSHQLLDGQQAAAVGDPLAQLPVQATAPVGRQPQVAPEMHLGGQVEAGLLDTLRQHGAEHLQVEGDVAVEIRVARGHAGPEFLQAMAGPSRGGCAVHRPVAGRGDQALPIIATSVAKSIFWTSMPSPSV